MLVAVTQGVDNKPAMLWSEGLPKLVIRPALPVMCQGRWHRELAREVPLPHRYNWWLESKKTANAHNDAKRPGDGTGWKSGFLLRGEGVNAISTVVC